MKRTLVTRIATLAILVASTLTASTACAITGNFQPDATRSSVGLVVFYSLDQNGNRVPVTACSGVLISPTVLLTAAHACVTTSVVVCFDAGPITFSIQNGQVQFEGVTALYDGHAYPNPNYAINVEGKKGSPAFCTHDVAVVILDQPVPASVVSNYGVLPSAGLVDTLPVNTPATLVGYGSQVHLSPRKVGGENTWAGVLARNSASSKLLSVNFAWSDEFIRCSANAGQGKGGIAYGDSGGPVFLGQSNVVLALNSYVTNSNCAGETYHCRVDVPKILEWIALEVSIHG
ncbi:MAG: trypsin-like serine protease [Candidatus Bathyarchaeia archaeon]